MSQDIRSLISEQENTIKLIQKTQSNFKKTPKPRLTRGYVQVRIETLNEYWQHFRNTHVALVKLATKEEINKLPYFVEDFYTSCEDMYINLKADMTDMLENSTESSNMSNNSQSSNSASSDVKLPKINIPQFSGNYQDWMSFSDLFTSIIHNNKNLSNVQKMHYLKSCLSNEAEQLLKHLSVTEANYELAWKILQNRYNNKRIIINSILNRLFNQKKIQTVSAKSIRELLDTTVECLNKLKVQDINISSWDVLIIYITVNKLDSESHKEWEEEISSLSISVLPTIDTLQTFLEKRFRILEMIQPSTSKSAQSVNSIRTKSFHITTEVKCIYCQQNHPLFNCKEFIKLDTDKRSEFAQNQRLCFNCLIPGHSVKYCKNKSSCRRCGRKHHSLLHRISTTNIPNTPKSEQNTQQQEEIISHLTLGKFTALMSTAVVIATNDQGQRYTLRALLDPCSQESFISESAAQTMSLKRKYVNGHVSGVDQMKTPIKFATNLQITSRIKPDIKIKITTYIVRRISNIMPAKRIEHVENWDHLRGLELADPTYHTPGHIDLLLGIDVYNEVLQPGLIKATPGSPIALQTHLGWILSGKVTVGDIETNIVSLHLNMELNSMLRKFWELETIDEEKYTLTPEESKAEELYQNNTKRDIDGRYIVNLPMKNDPPILPLDTRDIAIERWKSTERRLDKNPQLREEYNKVLQEYLQLNHMEKIEEPDKDYKHNCVYLPHHAVVRENRETTKVRVVFDASCRGSNDVSLNDELLVGPPLTEDLRNIILRWRKHKIAFVADIEKMYRQIKVCKQHTDYQRIVWRSDPTKLIEDYRLLTVTFGTSCAPYLAIKTLRQTAIDEGAEYPKVKKIILQDFYMDDVLSGEDNEEEAIEVQKQLTKILYSGGFKLQKWKSNSERFIQELKLHKESKESETVEILARQNVKTLGIMWETKGDLLSISNQIGSAKDKIITKRTVLANIASLFDPIGWIAPSIVLAKIFMQRLWRNGIDWDVEISEDMKKEWLNFKRELSLLNKISINRWIYTTPKGHLELHGFADASASAYAAVIYARTIDETNEVKVSLITAKTKVSPIKQVTLPRLELCAATLLSRLLKQVAVALRVDNKDVFAWSDSQVVLAWIHGDPMKWKPFVKNRVIEIIETLDANHWFYVNTKQNPADPASRGVMPAKLLSTEIWWNGPEMLKEKDLKLVKGYTLETNLEKRKTIQEEIITCNLTTLKDKNEDILTLLRRFSSLEKLVRVIAYCRRWLLVLSKNKNKRENLPDYPTLEERNAALTTCIKLSQQVEFSVEIENLQHNKPLKKNSRLLSLTPFLDEQNVLRVGGRLKHADVEFVKKHPIIISKHNLLLPLLLSEAHTRTLHGGPQIMVTYLRSKYWLVNAMNSIKRFVRNCVNCAKFNATTKTQLMGELPECRVRPSRPFSISGVDFAGPINVRMSKGRGAKSYKAYICLFVCMATKAVHIELVSDMTTQTFLAAFRRFVSRRGHVYEIWSDHGTTFIGAEKELISMWKQSNTGIPKEFASLLDKEGTKWKYIPPGAPNFGGLWESGGVKSTKFHLKRVIKDSTLTFEELNTVLIQIEACLNSRPISALSDHPEDLEPLTPGHLLVGEPLVVLPAQNITDLNMNMLDRWKVTVRMVQDFWKRWQTEYVTKLQERSKWKEKKKECEVGDLVIIKDLRFPVGRWPMGRVIKKYTGSDNLTRIYDVRTANGIVKRPVTKLCYLPIVSETK